MVLGLDPRMETCSREEKGVRSNDRVLLRIGKALAGLGGLLLLDLALDLDRFR